LLRRACCLISCSSVTVLVHHNQFNVRFSALALVRLFPKTPFIQTVRSCASHHSSPTCFMSSFTHSWHVFFPYPCFEHLPQTNLYTYSPNHPLTCVQCPRAVFCFRTCNNSTKETQTGLAITKIRQVSKRTDLCYLSRGFFRARVKKVFKCTEQRHEYDAAPPICGGIVRHFLYLPTLFLPLTT